MVLILLTYGGWNEAAYISADLKNVKRDMIRILLIGTAVVTVLYVADQHGLSGRAGPRGPAQERRGGSRRDAHRLRCERRHYPQPDRDLRRSIDHQRQHLHRRARSITRSARISQLERLRIWNVEGNNPRNAIIAQSLIAFALIIFGALSQDGFLGMVLYTSPVFWFFILLTGIRPVCAAPDRPQPRAPVPRSALSGHADPVLPDVRATCSIRAWSMLRARIPMSSAGSALACFCSVSP